MYPIVLLSTVILKLRKRKLKLAFPAAQSRRRRGFSAGPYLSNPSSNYEIYIIWYKTHRARTSKSAEA
jgi:hypothetical protein